MSFAYNTRRLTSKYLLAQLKKLLYKTICPGGEIGRRKGLKILSTQIGNFWCEWSQIRGNLTGNAGGNPELSFGTIFTSICWSKSVAIGAKQS